MFAVLVPMLLRLPARPQLPKWSAESYVWCIAASLSPAGIFPPHLWSNSFRRGEGRDERTAVSEKEREGGHAGNVSIKVWNNWSFLERMQWNKTVKLAWHGLPQKSVKCVNKKYFLKLLSRWVRCAQKEVTFAKHFCHSREEEWIHFDRKRERERDRKGK